MYLDTANLERIKEGIELGILKGVTTNPTILSKEELKRDDQLKKIIGILPSDLNLFVQLHGLSSEEFYDDFIHLENTVSKLYDVVYKIPLNQEGLKVIKKIKGENSNIKILATAIYSAEQMFLAGLAGCEYVAPYVNRIQVSGVNPYDEITLARQFFDDKGLACKIMGASFKNINQVKYSYAAGAHYTTVSLELIKEMHTKIVVNEAIKVFDLDGKNII